MESLPEYERTSLRMAQRANLAASFSRQIELTTAPFLDRAMRDCAVIDIGCGYGDTLGELASVCRFAVGVEPNHALARKAEITRQTKNLQNVSIKVESADDIREEESFDIAIMDNVLAHIQHQNIALWKMSRCLRVGGVAYILVPNKLWPIEASYNLPLLSYMPTSWANQYLRSCHRGQDYTDASFTPTYSRLKRFLNERIEWDARFSPPADIMLAEGGRRWTYRLGVELLKRFPALWAISKSFLVVAKKISATPAYSG